MLPWGLHYRKLPTLRSRPTRWPNQRVAGINPFTSGSVEPKKSRRRPGPTPARQRVANPRQGDFAKPDCEKSGERPATHLIGKHFIRREGSAPTTLVLSS